ncbi:MAG: hypothetical protein ACREUN_13845 [Burkholderiales bacterium]
MLMIVHTFVRTTLEVELGVCARHRRLRLALDALSIACVVSLFVAPMVLALDESGIVALWVAIAALVALVVARAYAGVQAVSINKLTDQHAWLARTGKAFRAALSELPN